jgi:hypothetical protein
VSVSVVVVSYRRQAHLGAILEAWLKETPDVWLCDCSKNGFATTLPVKVVRFVPDPGNRVRHAVALLAGGDVVIKADDDIAPKPGLAADFEQAMATLGPAILGVHGRIFRGKDYYRDTTMFGAKQLKSPQKVDFVGVITAAPRALLSMDLRGCRSEVEDLFWQMRCYPKAAKYVIATDKFVNLPECKDKGRLCAGDASRKIRRDFYAKYFAANYGGRRH